MLQNALARSQQSDLSPGNVEDAGAVRINRDQNGLIEGENFITEIKHPGL